MHSIVFIGNLVSLHQRLGEWAFSHNSNLGSAPSSWGYTSIGPAFTLGAREAVERLPAKQMIALSERNHLPREQMIETVIAGIDGLTSSPHGSLAKFLVTSNVR